jgi:DNA-binding transcriptional regulator YiaG
MKTIAFDQLCRKTMTPASRRRAKSEANVILRKMMLKELREALGLSQRELARALKTTQPGVSKMENQSDMQIATLHRIVGALGGEIEIIARFPNVNVQIVLPPAA